jgi:uncharacterized protein with GYD domain
MSGGNHSAIYGLSIRSFDYKGGSMQKYLFYGSYTPEGYKGLLAEGGSVRIDVSKQALQSVGGSLEAFYYSNGEQDFYIIVNLPDNVSSTAITLAGNASGTFRIRAVALLTPEEMDEAVKMKVDFRPPGH